MQIIGCKSNGVLQDECKLITVSTVWQFRICAFCALNLFQKILKFATNWFTKKHELISIFQFTYGQQSFLTVQNHSNYRRYCDALMRLLQTATRRIIEDGSNAERCFALQLSADKPVYDRPRCWLYHSRQR